LGEDENKRIKGNEWKWEITGVEEKRGKYRVQVRTGSSNRPRLCKQTGPIISRVTRKSE